MDNSTSSYPVSVMEPENWWTKSDESDDQLQKFHVYERTVNLAGPKISSRKRFDETWDKRWQRIDKVYPPGN